MVEGQRDEGSDSDEEGEVPEAEWSDWEASDGGKEPTQSLLDPAGAILPSPEAAMAHDAEHFNFDLLQFALQVRV